MYYLNLLSVQHCQFPHVPEGLKQVVIELSCGFQQLSIRFVLLRVHLQQLHHAVHRFVFIQHLETKCALNSIVRQTVHTVKNTALE